MKRRVGDIVTIIPNVTKQLYTCSSMNKYSGKTSKIIGINTQSYDLEIDGGSNYWWEDHLEPINNYIWI